MNLPQVPAFERSDSLTNAYPLRWEGHMCDGVGTTTGSEPGALLCANAEELWLKGRRGDFHLPRSAVVKVGRAGMYPWFFRGIRIRHRVSGYPAELQFGPFVGTSRSILTQLKSLGYSTS